MSPSRHIIASVPLASLIGLYYNSLLAGLLCFSSAVLIDIDHLIEYVIHFGFKISSPKEVYRACSKMANKEEEGGVKKLYLIFHAAEIPILLWLIFLLTKNIYVLSIAAGLTLHIAMDMSANLLHPCYYFIALRAKKYFNTIQWLKENKCTR